MERQGERKKKDKKKRTRNTKKWKQCQQEEEEIEAEADLNDGYHEKVKIGDTPKLFEQIFCNEIYGRVL